MKTVQYNGALISFAESKAECPECERKIPFNEIEDKWVKQDKQFIRFKCKCKRYIGITTDLRGDFVTYSLKNTPKY